MRNFDLNLKETSLANSVIQSTVKHFIQSETYFNYGKRCEKFFFFSVVPTIPVFISFNILPV